MGTFSKMKTEKNREKKENGRQFFFLAWKVVAAFVPDKNFHTKLLNTFASVPQIREGKVNGACHR